MSVDGMNYDNILIRGLSRIGDIMLLSLLWTIFSIPLVTIGASTTALLYASMKGITVGEGYMYKLFIKSFKENFKQSTAAWLVLAFVGFILSFDVYFWVDFWLINRITSVKLLIIFSIILLCIYILILLNTFTLIAKFQNTLFMTFKNALLLSIKNFPWTILIMITFSVVGFFIYISPTLLLLMGAFGVGALGLLVSWIFLRSINPFVNERNNVDNDDEDNINNDDDNNQ